MLNFLRERRFWSVRGANYIGGERRGFGKNRVPEDPTFHEMFPHLTFRYFFVWGGKKKKGMVFSERTQSDFNSLSLEKEGRIGGIPKKRFGES